MNTIVSFDGKFDVGGYSMRPPQVTILKTGAHSRSNYPDSLPDGCISRLPNNTAMRIETGKYGFRQSQTSNVNSDKNNSNSNNSRGCNDAIHKNDETKFANCCTAPVDKLKTYIDRFNYTPSHKIVYKSSAEAIKPSSTLAQEGIEMKTDYFRKYLDVASSDKNRPIIMKNDHSAPLFGTKTRQEECKKLYNPSDRPPINTFIEAQNNEKLMRNSKIEARYLRRIENERRVMETCDREGAQQELKKMNRINGLRRDREMYFKQIAEDPMN